MQQHHLKVRRTARFATLGSAEQAPSQLWFVLHGHSQLAASFLQQFEILNDGRRLIVAPEALSRFYLETDAHGRHGDRVGASWMTREDREVEIEDYVGYLDDLARHLQTRWPNPGSLRVLGFSQGVATAARWAARSPAPIADLILWGSLLPKDVLAGIGADSWRDTQVTLVRGSEDVAVPHELLVAQVAELGEKGVPCRALSFNGGHRLDDELLSTLAREMAP